MSKVYAVVRSAREAEGAFERQELTIQRALTANKVSPSDVVWCHRVGAADTDEWIEQVLQGETKAIYVAELSRLGRDADKMMALLEAMDVTGTELVIAEMGGVNVNGFYQGPNGVSHRSSNGVVSHVFDRQAQS